jgi:hypothetical protein
MNLSLFKISKLIKFNSFSISLSVVESFLKPSPEKDVLEIGLMGLFKSPVLILLPSHPKFF